MKPKAITNILVEEMSDEVLVYDLDRHRAHCLNPTAAFLLQHADGTRDLGQLTSLAAEEFDTPASEEVIRVGLKRLERAKLVRWDAQPSVPEGMSRRKALRQLATLGLAIPAVMTIVSPLAAQGATTIPIKDCNLANVGRCCVNNKLCIQAKNGKFQCAVPGC
jgi:hypothetical protein